jgi:hypothetical protein
VDVGVDEALAQDALADHAGGSEENYVHGFHATARMWTEVARSSAGEPVAKARLFRRVQSKMTPVRVVVFFPKSPVVYILRAKNAHFKRG